MELNELKSSWNALEIPEKRIPEIQSMLNENRHPVLRKIKLQLTVEITAWFLFLLAYYTLFDGDRKPLAVNGALIIAVSGVIVCHIRGYFLFKYLIHGKSIAESLNNYFWKLKQYVVWSLAFRVLFMAALLYYFTYDLPWETNRFLMLFGITLVFGTQLYLLDQLWRRRLNKLKDAVYSFSQN